jgi:dienelactone hydrolase
VLRWGWFSFFLFWAACAPPAPGADPVRAALLAAVLLLAAPPLSARDETVTLQLDSGRAVQAQLRFPEGAHGPLPALMLFGGFRSAHETLDLVRVEEPLLLASFDYPYDPPRKFIFPYSLRHLPEFRQAIADTFAGIGRLYAHLQSRSDVDAARITIAGASAGAPFAVISAAQHGIPGLVVVQGFGRTRDVVAQQFIRRWQPRHGDWVRAPARGLAAVLIWMLDIPHAEAHAVRLRSGQKALMVTARGDDMIPPEATEALWQAFRQTPAQHERLDLPGAHLRSSADDQIADILGHALQWMRAQGLR